MSNWLVAIVGGAVATVAGGLILFFLLPAQQTPALSPSNAASKEAPLSLRSWHLVKGPYGSSFTVEMPAAPKYSAEQLITDGGSTYTLHNYMFEDGDRVFAVGTSFLPSDVHVSNPRINIQSGLSRGTKNLTGSEWRQIEWVEHRGLPAAEVFGRRGAYELRSYSLMKGRQLFTLMYSGPAGTTRSPDAEQFMNSLTVQ